MKIISISGKDTNYYLGQKLATGEVSTILKCQQQTGNWCYFGYSEDKKTLFIVSDHYIDSEEIQSETPEILTP